jgi:DNA topoisomerase I
MTIVHRIARDYLIAQKLTDEEVKAESNRRRKKIDSVRKLAQNITKLRHKVAADLKVEDEKTRLTALAVWLIDKTCERVGNQDSASNGHFGVTGWRAKHIEIDGSKVRLTYIGKSGMDQDKEFTDKHIASVLSELSKRSKKNKTSILTTEDGFSIKSDKVNRYLRDFDITAKDLRGYGANKLVTEALKAKTGLTGEDERKKFFGEVLTRVADKVGHLKSTLKVHYLLPGIEEAFVKNGKVKKLENL